VDPACERLDRPPHPSSYFRLPDDFGRRFMLFVDTEEEFDWTKPQSRDERSTTHVKSLRQANRRLREMGAHAVYLVDHPIATDPEAIETLRPLMETGECDIGAHLHPWVNPPFEEEMTLANTFAGNLPIELEEAKLRCLTQIVENAFGRRPIIYRAGRYGVGGNSARLLESLGYKVDVSVRPSFDYSSEGGPDFSGAKPVPYRVQGLIEIPHTSTYLGGLRKVGDQLFPRTAKSSLLRSALHRAGLLTRISLTPEGGSIPEALQAVERLLDDGHQLFSLSFHSPSIEPGHTPYVRDEADLAQFYRWLESVFGLLTRRGVTAASVDELVRATQSVGVPQSRN
jgi:hypothetical protein